MKFAILILTGLDLLGQGLTREGNNWVRTITNAGQINPRMALQVVSQGRVTIKGVDGNRFSYTLVQRTGVKSETDAEKRLSGGGVVVRSLGGVLLVVSEGASPNVSTDLVLEVPRQMRAASIKVGFGGDVDVTDFDGSVEAQTPAGVIRGDRINGGMIARTGGGKIQLGRINGQVECVTGADSISIDNAAGQVNCQTAGGEIAVKEAGGSVVLSSEGGNILVGQARGTVFADTRGGSIQVGSSQGVKLASAAGAVRVKGAAGPMDISTALGNIMAELMAGTPLQNSSLTAPAGDIIVLIPSNLAVTVMATSESGAAPRIVSDFSELRSSPLLFTRPPVTIQGAINGGGPVLRVSTGRGVIYVRKSK